MPNQNALDNLQSASALLDAARDDKVLPAWQVRDALAHIHAAMADIESEESTPDTLYPIADWQIEVANNYTQLGYRDWAAHQRESHKESAP